MQAIAQQIGFDRKLGAHAFDLETDAAEPLEKFHQWENLTDEKHIK